MAILSRGATCLLLLVFVSRAQAGCRQDWSWDHGFNKEGLSKCGNAHREYIKGFYRSQQRNPDVINGLEAAMCCTASWPFQHDAVNVVYADWWHNFDANYRWNSCPRGYFLQGLYRTGGKNLLYNIEEGRCLKPATHPYQYGHCYELDSMISFDNKGWTQCKDGYFLTGLYRGSCDQMYCIEKMKCCKMASKPIKINSLASAKLRVMDHTLYDMALLGHYLGYGWCAGCRAPYVGEGFDRQGDVYAASTKGPCSGHWNHKRLKLSYGDFKFVIKSIQFSKPVIQDLKPQAVDTGVLRNGSPFPVTNKVTRTSQVTRSVSHTTTSEWKHSHELGITIGYNPPGATGGVSASASYTFGYEQSQTTQNSKGESDTSSFSVDQSITIPANSAVKWTMILSKTRRTVSYTAKVLIHFSTEFQGFLRWGGGYNGGSTNYHYKYRGWGSRPTFNYRFGSAKQPFYEALKEQNEYNHHPWMWPDLEAKYSYARTLIKSLCSEGRYEFTLTGKFEDISGKHVEISWGSARRLKRSASDEGASDGQDKQETPKKVVAKQQAGDPPSVSPPPPDVELDPVGEENGPSETMSEEE